MDQIPETINPVNIKKLVDVAGKIRQLHKELSNEPFEYVADATREEHADLVKIFVQLISLVTNALTGALDAFRKGQIEFVPCSDILEIRSQLGEQVKGQSATAMLLAEFFKGGELCDPEGQ